ncbi:MAG: tRNA lysidine(34) synthetase TilS [Anaerolineae bacterium]|nr:MAG: tRNA lysidine(34) synthetase TilS [Anaerolineae bacterium]
MSLIEQVRQVIERYGLLSQGGPVVVGVSGGPDSLCLLHLLWRLAEDYGLTLHVAHLNHQIRGMEADADAIFVADLAANWRLPCTVVARDVPGLARRQRLAVEEAARQARYTFLAEVAGEVGSCTIAVGHNADDQAETVLMHFLRGAGLAGLRGMLPKTPLSDYRLLKGQTGTSLSLIRPLLETPRAEIEAYCARHGLKPRFDRSNLDTTYFRNRLRHELLPYLESYRPNISQVIRRTARVVADDYALLREVLADAWADTTRAADEEAIVFDLESWRALPPGLQRATLRKAVHRLRRSLRNINFVHIEDAVVVAREKSTGAAASLPQGLQLTVGYETLTVASVDYKPLPLDWPALLVERLPLSLPGVTPLPGPGGWQVEARWLSAVELPPDWATHPDRWQAFLDARAVGEGLVLRQRRQGDRFQPQGMGGRSKSLSDFLINVKVSAAWRDWIPLAVSRDDDRIVWVAGWRLDERARITPATEQVLHLRFAERSG